MTVGWWDHLTQAQGTVIGGGFVLVAAFVAFGTGFLQRRRQQRNYHYEEAKRAYLDSMAYALGSRLMYRVPKSEQLEVARQLESRGFDTSAQLYLTVPAESADVVTRYTLLAKRKSMQQGGFDESQLPSIEPEQDEDWDAAVLHVRQEMARHLSPGNPQRSRLGKWSVPDAAKVPKQLFKLGSLAVRWG